MFSIATADNRCVGDVECTLQQGAATTTTAVPATATPAPAAVPSTDASGKVVDPPVTLEATTTTAAPPPPLAAFGESVMLGAKAQLQAGGFQVDAAENRQAKDMVATIKAAQTAGQLGQVVVVQTGTNGTVTDDEIAAIVAAMPAGTRLYFMTVKADVPWVAGNNEKIRAIPTQHPNVGIIDWDARAPQIASELSPSDGGAHLRTKNAMQFYANMIFDGIGRSELDRPVTTDSVSTTG